MTRKKGGDRESGAPSGAKIGGQETPSTARTEQVVHSGRYSGPEPPSAANPAARTLRQWVQVYARGQWVDYERLLAEATAADERIRALEAELAETKNQLIRVVEFREKAEAERDALKARVAELEAMVSNAGGILELRGEDPG